MKRRLLYLGVAGGMIPIGLITRSFRADADATTPLGFIETYLPDTLWAVMFFYLFAALFVGWRTTSLFMLTVAFTVGIELSQLYQGEPLATLRNFPPTGFLLGSTFLWSDIKCLYVGSIVASIGHALIPSEKQTPSNGTD